MIEKKELRRKICELKKTYSLMELRQKSLSVWSAVEQEEWFKNAQVMLVYWSMDDEVFTHDVVGKWSDEKVVLLPCICGDELEIRHFEGEKNLCLGERCSIPEPTGPLVHDLDSIDVIIVPGVAFDREGNRLGRGKGYYDRILNQAKAYKIGVCFDFQLLDNIPIESHDIKMDQVVWSRYT